MLFSGCFTSGELCSLWVENFFLFSFSDCVMLMSNEDVFRVLEKNAAGAGIVVESNNLDLCV